MICCAVDDLVSRCVEPGLEGLGFPESIIINLVASSHHAVQVLVLVALEDIFPQQWLTPKLDICVDREAVAAMEAPVHGLVDSWYVERVPVRGIWFSMIWVGSYLPGSGQSKNHLMSCCLVL